MSSSSDRFAFATIRDLGVMLRSGEATPTQLAEYFCERLETVGRRFNAVVTVTTERAMREARQAEAELAAGYDRGPLHGIPYGAKDLLAAAGAPTSWGVGPLKDQTFDEDATVIKRLRDAGAVLVGKLAMVELAGGMGYRQPNAAFTGPGITPWNDQAWSGGSSSGSGSAVAAGAVPFAIGSETAGSILSPAGNCGVSGLRPTYGRVSRHGAMALCWTLDKLGPLCRTTDDCGLVLDAIAGADRADPTTLPQPYRYQPEVERESGFRLGVYRAGLDSAEPEVRANFEASLEQLGQIATLEEVEMPDFPWRETLSMVLNAEGAAAYEELVERGIVSELTAPEDRYGGYARTLLPAVDYLRAMRVRQQMCVAIDQIFARYDGVLEATSPSVASPLDRGFNWMRPRDTGQKRSQMRAIGNLCGQPAISVPNGFGERGLPTGLCVSGRVGDENAILAVARAYQARTDWHTKHPQL